MTFVIVENVWELLNINERATILACDDILRPDHSVVEESTVLSENSVAGEKAQTKVQLGQRRGRLTDKAVLDVLQQTHGHCSRAAQLLGVSDRTLYRHIQRMRGG